MNKKINYTKQKIRKSFLNLLISKKFINNSTGIGITVERVWVNRIFNLLSFSPIRQYLDSHLQRYYIIVVIIDDQSINNHN